MLMRLDNETGEAVCACVRVRVSLSDFHLGASLTRRQSEWQLTPGRAPSNWLASHFNARALCFVSKAKPEKNNFIFLLSSSSNLNEVSGFCCTTQ